jgi:hypothetical protein
MASGERESRGAQHKTSSELPYEGTLGRTRTEPVQVWMPDGTIAALSIYVGVDAQTDPALAALARAGTLHQVAPGVDLAIPFVYHDRAARLMVLVVPEGLRHRALALRAEHIALIAADAGHAVPEYVRDAELVIAARGLCARIGSGQAGSKLNSVALDLGQDLRVLAQRERELSRRERLLGARERALKAAEHQHDRALPFVGSGQGSTVADSELEEIDEEAEAAYQRALAQADNDSGLPDEDEEVVTAGADGELEEVEDIEAGEDVQDDLAGSEDMDADDMATEEDVALAEAALVAPDAFMADHDAELWLTENEGRAWLFVRHRPSPPRDASGMELLLQLDPTAETPVALITLVFDVQGSPEVRRGAIDPGDPAQVRALALLAEHFEVELVGVTGPHDFDHWASLHAPCEANARATLARLTRKDDFDPQRFARVRSALLRTPLPWRDLSHPFQPGAFSAPQNATEAAVQLDELSEWLAPERRERVRLMWCIPDELIDEHCVHRLGAALDWGLSLSGPLSARAIELGLAQDQRTLVERRIHGLCRASRAPEDAGLEPAVLRALWSEALEQAARLGVTLADEAREFARQHAGERAMLHATALSDSQSSALEPLRVRALGEPCDVLALTDLLEQGAHRDLLAGCRALVRVSPEEAGTLFARVALRHDPAAVDALLSLLAPTEEPRVRIGAALALAHRRAVHAIDELALSLAREDTSAWRLFALALGRYGGGSFRAVARALATRAVRSERVALVYAFLCCHGARAQVRAKARSSEPAEAELAERALSLAAGCRSDEHALVGLEEPGDLAVFCRIFDRTCAAVHA